MMGGTLNIRGSLVKEDPNRTILWRRDHMRGFEALNSKPSPTTRDLEVRALKLTPKPQTPNPIPYTLTRKIEELSQDTRDLLGSPVVPFRPFWVSGFPYDTPPTTRKALITASLLG